MSQDEIKAKYESLSREEMLLQAHLQNAHNADGKVIVSPERIVLLNGRLKDVRDRIDWLRSYCKHPNRPSGITFNVNIPDQDDCPDCGAKKG